MRTRVHWPALSARGHPETEDLRFLRLSVRRNAKFGLVHWLPENTKVFTRNAGQCGHSLSVLRSFLLESLRQLRPAVACVDAGAFGAGDLAGADPGDVRVGDSCCAQWSDLERGTFEIVCPRGATRDS